MMQLEERIDSLCLLGDILSKLLKEEGPELHELFVKCSARNPWFDKFQVRYATEQVVNMLERDALEGWISLYEQTKFSRPNPLRVAVIMAGNIPLVGFHDFLCVFLTGHVFVGKLSTQDDVLLPFLVDKLLAINPRCTPYIVFKEFLKSSFDAVIATGSNNTSRYFDYYFGKYPHIIRRNRNSIAILTGNESQEELRGLARDICLYYGKGCRSVSKLFVPQNYDFDPLLDALSAYKYIADFNKFFNNYEYYKAIYLLNKSPYIDNGFLLLTPSSDLSSPLAVLYYESYSNIQSVFEQVNMMKENLQCIVASQSICSDAVSFGITQNPALNDYADNVDTISFLLDL